MEKRRNLFSNMNWSQVIWRYLEIANTKNKLSIIKPKIDAIKIIWISLELNWTINKCNKIKINVISDPRYGWSHCVQNAQVSQQILKPINLVLKSAIDVWNGQHLKCNLHHV